MFFSHTVYHTYICSRAGTHYLGLQALAIAYAQISGTDKCTRRKNGTIHLLCHITTHRRSSFQLCRKPNRYGHLVVAHIRTGYYYLQHCYGWYYITQLQKEAPHYTGATLFADSGIFYRGSYDDDCTDHRWAAEAVVATHNNLSKNFVFNYVFTVRAIGYF